MDGEIITCGCCGRGIRDNAEENTHFGQVPYPDDTGFGMCVSCGGDKNASDLRKRLGWAGCIFFDARISWVKEGISPENRAKFEAMSYEKQVAIITRLVEKGAII